MQTLRHTVGIVLAVALLPGAAGALADDAAEVRKLRAEVAMLRARIRTLESELAAAKGLSSPASAPAEKELAGPEALMATAPTEPDYGGMTGGQKNAAQKAYARTLEEWQQKYRGKTVHWTLIVDDVRVEKSASEPSVVTAVCLVAHSTGGTTMEVKFPPSQAARMLTIRKQQAVKVTARIRACQARGAKGQAWSLDGVACDGADAPASAPSADAPPASTTDPPPADAPDGPEALLAKAPAEPDCGGMTAAQREAAQKAHAEAMEKWQQACRGKTVTWTVILDDVQVEKGRSYRSGSVGIVAVHLRAHSSAGTKMFVAYPGQSGAALQKMQKRQVVRITARIVTWTPTGPAVGWSLEGIGFQAVQEPATQPAEGGGVASGRRP